jgi:hypothetical protein
VGWEGRGNAVLKPITCVPLVTKFRIVQRQYLFRVVPGSRLLRSFYKSFLIAVKFNPPMQHIQSDVDRSCREVTSLAPRLGQMYLNKPWALREKLEGCGTQRDMEIFIVSRHRTYSGVGHVTEK